MIYKRKLLPMLICAAFLSGCALNPPVNDSNTAPLKIEPDIQVAGASSSAASMYQLGRYYQGQNRYEQAIAAYKKSLAADSGFAESHNGLGVIYSKIGRYDDATAEFMLALQQSPQSDHIHSNLGYARFLQGNYDESIKSFKQALAINPDNKHALKNISLAYEKVGNTDQVVTGDKVSETTTAQTQVSASENKTQDSWELKAAEKKAAGRESSGLIIRASQPQMEVAQIAPAVYQLRRYESPETPDKKPQLSRIGGMVVANGNGVTGMAKRVSVFLRQGGYPVARLTNQKPFKVMKSQVQYRAGYQADAKELQAKIPGEPAVIQRDDLQAGINIKLVLGKDLVDNQAYFVGK